MKILFITGSLAASRDGVADYTLRLGEALSAQGVSVRFLSWNESSIVSPQITSSSLRLPGNFPLRAKISQAQHFLSSFAPDVVSLQFVPYAFEARGLPVGLAEELLPVIQKTPLHIFIHELWVLPCMRSSLKSRAVGSLLQRPIILKNLRQLAPRLIHTSTPLYRDILLKENLPVRGLLRLPGNIPFVPLPFPIEAPSARKTRQLGFFGNIFASAPIDHFFEYLVSLQSQTGLALTVTSAGNLPSPMIKRWNKLTKKYRGRLHIERFGFLSPRETSYYLQSLDFLLSAYSPTFCQKSGTIAAAQEFGKPTVLLSAPEVPQTEKLPSGVFDGLTAQMLLAPAVLPPYSPLQAVTARLISDFDTFAKS